MKTIAIVPARGGSKGIPMKNLYPVCRKPLISYCLNAIMTSDVDSFFVSTDSKEIKSYCESIDVEVIDRPQNLAKDTSPTIDCIKHAVEYLSLDKEDILLTIQPTSPLILAEDINSIIEKLYKYDHAITVCKHHKILWEQINDTILPVNHNPLNRKRRQDSNKVFNETGSIYGTKVKNILQNNSIHGISNVGYIEIPKSRSFEVDDYEDIRIIESLLSIKPDIIL